MIEKYVFPGQRVELKAVNLKEGEKNKTHNTKVYDVVGEDRIEIIMPMEQTKLILLPVDGEYGLCFYSGAVLYECVARVIDRYKSNNVYILLMELETNLRKFQRREYYRYSCALEMDSRNICEEEIANEERNEYALVPGLPLKRSIIVDISGGGLRFVSDYKYDKDSVILCHYTLMIKGETREFDLVSKILDVKEITTGKGGYEHRVQYLNAHSQDREEIIQYIFDEERKNRKRERGF